MLYVIMRIVGFCLVDGDDSVLLIWNDVGVCFLFMVLGNVDVVDTFEVNCNERSICNNNKIPMRIDVIFSFLFEVVLILLVTDVVAALYFIGY